MFNRPRLAALLIAGATLLAAPALALLVQPIVIDMQTSGAKASAALTVVNDRRTPETVEVTVGKLALPERGAPEITPDKGDDFLIFPPRATIGPGKTQVFRLRWIGEPVLPQSRLYMFSTTELPVNKPAGTGIQLLYSIQSLVTVSSPQLKAALSVAGVQRGLQPAPPPPPPGAAPPPPFTPAKGLELTVANTGPGIDYVSHYRLRLKAGPTWSKTVDSPDVGRSVGLGLIGPQSRRVFFVAVPDIPAEGALSAELERAPGR